MIISGFFQELLAGINQRSDLESPPSYVAKYELGDRRLDVLEFLDLAAAIGFPCTFLTSLGRK
jgi:hypothetical protein